MVEHRNVVRLFSETEQLFDFGQRDVWALFHSIAFDFSVWELWGALLYGGRLMIVSRDTTRSPQEFYRLLCREGVTVLNQTPSAFSQLIDAQPRCQQKHSLRVVIFGGEQLEPRILRRWIALNGAKKAQLINMYGITETTVHVTYHLLSAAEIEFGRGSPIGKPISDLQAYLLDRDLQPTSAKVPGEIYVGGAGVARGYLNQPVLTADRFIADPHSGDSRARLYKTGDLGRRNDDGTLEYLGRNDNQVKIRGYRIELGEIESEIFRNKQVADAVVVAREDIPGTKRLVAYVVSNANNATVSVNEGEGSSGDLVRQWKSAWDATYAGLQLERPSFAGWLSSYTRLPIPDEQMREWLTCSTNRIRELGPRHVLEIGCGIGVLIEQLAADCESYYGTDLSTVAIRNLRGWLATQESLKHVKVSQSAATDLSAIPDCSVDTVILNSVVHHFPNISYLLLVIKRVLGGIDHPGRLFIGDIRNLDLLNLFHSSVQIANAGPDMTVGQVRDRIRRAVENENQLVIAPEFFVLLPRLLPQIKSVDVQLKRGRFDNELNAFRYDVVLSVGARYEQPAIETYYDGPEPAEYAESELASSRPAALRLVRVPNRRLSRDIQNLGVINTSDAHMRMDKLTEVLAKVSPGGEDPEVFWALGARYNYAVRITWSPNSSRGEFDVDLVSKSEAVQLTIGDGAEAHPVYTHPSWERYATNPTAQNPGKELERQLRNELKERMPDYMVPSTFVVVEALPLTPNGKLDRNALPAPDIGRSPVRPYEAPQGRIEATLTRNWQEVLGVATVGRDDNFFELGGDSLLGMRLMAKVSESLSMQPIIATIHQYPTVRQMAELIEALLSDALNPSVPSAAAIQEGFL
jgi:acyl-coenzyme A synthetase/AMP-(fatty) acid ligase/acyl carrier protein